MATAVVPNLEQGRFGYLKPKDVARLAEAYRFSEAAHAGQTRQSGDRTSRTRSRSPRSSPSGTSTARR